MNGYVFALACVPARAADDCAGARSTPLPTVSDADVRALQCVANRERQRRGRRALRRVEALDRAATAHSADMVQRGYFDHRSPGGSTPAHRARDSGYMDGVSSWRVGENLAWGSGPLATPQSIVKRWLDSPPHRAVLLNPEYTDLGLGIAEGAPKPGVSDAATYTLLAGRNRR